MLQSSSAPVIILLWIFFSKCFSCRNSRCSSSQLVLSQDHPAVGFFWIAGTLTNSRMRSPTCTAGCLLWLTLGEVLGGILSLKKKSLPGSLCSTVWMFLKGRAGSPRSPVCVNKQEHLLKQIPVSTTFLRLSKAANGGTSGSHGMCFPDALGICHSALHKERSHLFPF